MSPPASIPSKGWGGSPRGGVGWGGVGGRVPGPFYTIFTEEGTLEVRFCFQYLLFPPWPPGYCLPSLFIYSLNTVTEGPPCGRHSQPAFFAVH